MFREYDTDYNIQFFDNKANVVDHNINFYAEDDATGVNVWDEDDCIATLLRQGDEWVADRVAPFYAMRDDELESDSFDEVMDFVSRLEKIVEMV